MSIAKPFFLAFEYLWTISVSADEWTVENEEKHGAKKSMETIVSSEELLVEGQSL